MIQEYHNMAKRHKAGFSARKQLTTLFDHEPSPALTTSNFKPKFYVQKKPQAFSQAL